MIQHSETGSVLVEALVAILIVAAMAGLWFQTLGGSAAQQRGLADRQLAMLVARSQLAGVGIVGALSPGATSGSDAGMVWRIDTARYPDAGDGIDKITVAVGRPDGPDLAVLQTLRLGR